MSNSDFFYIYSFSLCAPVLTHNSLVQSGFDSMAKKDVKIDFFLLLKFHLFSLFPSPKCEQMHSH